MTVPSAFCLLPLQYLLNKSHKSFHPLFFLLVSLLVSPNSSSNHTVATMIHLMWDSCSQSKSFSDHNYLDSFLLLTFHMSFLTKSRLPLNIFQISKLFSISSVMTKLKPLSSCTSWISPHSFLFYCNPTIIPYHLHSCHNDLSEDVINLFKSL